MLAKKNESNSNFVILLYTCVSIGLTVFKCPFFANTQTVIHHLKKNFIAVNSLNIKFKQVLLMNKI